MINPILATNDSNSMTEVSTTTTKKSLIYVPLQSVYGILNNEVKYSRRRRLIRRKKGSKKSTISMNSNSGLCEHTIEGTF